MDKESRKEIVIALVSSTLFLIIVQPSLNLGWGWLTSTGSAISDKLSNHLYQTAALGPRNWVVVDLGTFGFSLLLGFYVTAFGMLIFTYRKLKAAKEEIEEESIDALKNQLSAHEKRLRRLFVAFPVAIVFMALVGGFTVFRYSADLKLNTSFSHRLTILTPSISQKEIDKLRADWAKMKSRHDYEVIVQEMDAIAKSASVDIPPPAMK